MTKRFYDQVAVVTGASRGLGQAVATAFAHEGSKVVVTSRNLRAAEVAAATIDPSLRSVLPLAVDVTNERDVLKMASAAADRFGTIDILVNNAGWMPPFREVVDLPVEEWDRGFAINLRGVFLCCRAALPHMINRGHGKIVNIAAGVLDERVHVGLSVYCAAKAAVVNFTRSLAAEVRRHGINVNAVDPGALKTAMAEQIEATPEARSWLEKQQIVDEALRFRPPDDILPLILFLSSDDSRALNGRFLQASSRGSPMYLQL